MLEENLLNRSRPNMQSYVSAYSMINNNHKHLSTVFIIYVQAAYTGNTFIEQENQYIVIN